MYLPSVRGPRIAPPYFSNAPTLRGLNWWRGLVWAVVPAPGGQSSPQGAFVHCGRELVRNVFNSFNGGVIPRGEAYGLSLSSVGAGLTLLSTLPTATPFSCFAFLVNRGSTSIQSLVDASGGSSGGWTFQFSYGSGELGLTRWGIADNPTVALGAVPTGGAASAVGLSHDGTTARFFLNGRFENVSSGGVNAPVGGQNMNALMRSNGLTPTTDVSLYVLYVWNRVLLDAEFQALLADPWAVVRSPELPFFTPGTGAAGTSARAFVAGFIG